MASWKKTLVSAFVVFHLVGTFTWLMPDNEIKHTTYPLVTWWMVGAGMWQSWDMFSPDPSNLNMYMHAKVQYTDGTVWNYEMPRMEKLNYVDRYLQERFRKYAENVHLDQNAQFWPALATWIVRQDDRHPGKIPASLELYRTWWFVPEPPADTSQPPVPTWNEFMFKRFSFVNGEPQG